MQDSKTGSPSQQECGRTSSLCKSQRRVSSLRLAPAKGGKGAAGKEPPNKAKTSSLSSSPKVLNNKRTPKEANEEVLAVNNPHMTRKMSFAKRALNSSLSSPDPESLPRRNFARVRMDSSASGSVAEDSPSGTRTRHSQRLDEEARECSSPASSSLLKRLCDGDRASLPLKRRRGERSLSDKRESPQGQMVNRGHRGRGRGRGRWGVTTSSKMALTRMVTRGLNNSTAAAELEQASE